MTDDTERDLIAGIRHLLRTGLEDEPTAIARFHRLLDVYGYTKIARAIEALAHEDLAQNATSLNT